MKKLSKSEQFLLALVGLFVIFYFYYSFYLNPILAKQSKSNQNIAKYTDGINTSKNIIKENEKLMTQITDLKNKSAEQDKLLPKSERHPEYIKDLKSMGDANAITISSISFGKPKEVVVQQTAQTTTQSSTTATTTNKDANAQAAKANTVYAVPASVSFTGSYSSIMGFISSVEKGNRFADISSVNIAKQDKAISGSININYYYSDVLTNKDIKYDFNTGTYGKNDLFN